MKLLDESRAIPRASREAGCNDVKYQRRIWVGVAAMVIVIISLASNQKTLYGILDDPSIKYQIHHYFNDTKYPSKRQVKPVIQSQAATFRSEPSWSSNTATEHITAETNETAWPSIATKEHEVQSNRTAVSSHALPGTASSKSKPSSTKAGRLNSEELLNLSHEVVLGHPPFYKFWNYTSHALDLPENVASKYTKRTSLEILQEILAEFPPGKEVDESDSCFRAQVNMTASLAERVSSGLESLAFPFFNMGMPKAGSTTLQQFFRCSGFLSCHAQNGDRMKNMINAGGTHPLLKSIRAPQQEGYMQLDVNFGNCSFPQIEFLDELHREYPDATFLLNVRPVMDWIQSATQHFGMRNRWSGCRLPGLVCTGHKTHNGRHCRDDDLRHWWCTHVKHIREFVKEYPSHRLVELDLYNPAQSADHLATLVNGNSTCWGHANENTRLKRKNASETGP